MFLFKAKAYIIGFLLSLLPSKLFIKLVDGTNNTKIGLDITNDEDLSPFHPEIVRVNKSDLSMQMVHNFKEKNIEYYIQIGRSEDSYNVIAQQIIDTDLSLSGLKKPLFYSVVNEDNNYTWTHIKQIDQFIEMNYGRPLHVTKGSYTSIVESAGMRKYKEHIKNDDIPKNKYHLIHFYYKPITFDNVLDNLLRFFMLNYFIYKLSKFIPAKMIIISESHDASKSAKINVSKSELRTFTIRSDGTLDGDKIIAKTDDNTYLVERYEGDFVFASAKGWKTLQNNFKTLGIYAGLYYHQPFLNYKGNTVLKAR